MKTQKKIIALVYCMLMLLPLSGCQLGIPSEITLSIKPIKCKSKNTLHTVPIEVKEIVDVRPEISQDVVGVYEKTYLCKLINFEQTVTEAFRKSISNAQNEVLPLENRKLILLGEIQEFWMSWRVSGAQSYTVGCSPLVISLSLIDPQEQIIWQKTIKGEAVNLYWRGRLSLTAGDYLKGTAKQCIVDAVKKLLEDESFWEAAKIEHQKTMFSVQKTQKTLAP